MKTTMGARIAMLVLTALILSAGAAFADPAENGPAVDPFKPLIAEAQPPVDIKKHVADLDPPKPLPPVTPPVQFKVHALAQDNANHVAVIELEGETYIAQAGMSLPSKENPLITVQKVTDSGVTVLDLKVNRLVKRDIARE